MTDSVAGGVEAERALDHEPLEDQPDQAGDLLGVEVVADFAASLRGGNSLENALLDLGWRPLLPALAKACVCAQPAAELGVLSRGD